jgi:iron-sulfur cluster assembly accessory protein
LIYIFYLIKFKIAVLLLICVCIKDTTFCNVDKYEFEEGVINYAQKGFVVLVDLKSDVYLKGVTMDWVRNGLNEGFDFKNPNERDRCGCGESFRV